MVIMKSENVYILIHSPLVGPLTWQPVAAEMRQRGLEVLTPTLQNSSDSQELFWKQHAESVSRSLAELSKDIPVTLVAHSGAGPLLPVIRGSLPNPVRAYVFVDAGLPLDGATRLDLMKLEDTDWANEFQTYLESGGRFPNWSSEELREILPDENLRTQMVAELQPRGLDFFTEPIPVFHGWPDAACIYILFSPPYQKAELQARQNGWITDVVEAGHFHMLVDPKTVVDRISHALNKVFTQ